MTRRSQRLQQKHPEVRHEISSHAVVWIVEQYFHFPISRSGHSTTLVAANFLKRNDGKRRSRKTQSRCQQAICSAGIIPHLYVSAHLWLSRKCCPRDGSGKRGCVLSRSDESNKFVNNEKRQAQ